MRVKQIRNYSEYTTLLDNDQKEQEILRQIFSVNVTEFFRDAEFFNSFRHKVIPELKNKLKNKERTIRIWCAGCASGEEPYSVAMVLHEEIGQSIPFQIIATDRNIEAINKAKLGRYYIRSLYKVSSDLLVKYFDLESRTQAYWPSIKNKIRGHVDFSVGDIVIDTPPSDLDIVLCRNVMIYMSEEAHRKMFQAFYKSLNPGGYLVLGQSEMILGESRTLFESVLPKERVYVKSSDSTIAHQVPS